MQYLTIPGRLPGWNEITDGHPMKQYRVKQEAMDIVGWMIRQQRIKPVGRASIKITCYEPNRKRDPSNVRAGAEKVILDALQNCGIIRNDNWRWLSDTPATVEYDKQRPRIEIEIMENPQCLNSKK